MIWLCVRGRRTFPTPAQIFELFLLALMMAVGVLTRWIIGIIILVDRKPAKEKHEDH